MTRWESLDHTIISEEEHSPQVMGVINVTPDSFSDGGRFPSPSQAADHARILAEQGAGLLDVGGESTRPGSDAVSLEVEIRRVIPTIEAIASTVNLPISVDTTKPEVARLALRAGASIINDIQGLSDPAMIRLAAETGAAVVVMHMAGTPKSMQVDPHYSDVVREVYDTLARRVDAAEEAGIPRSRIAIDPGIGFGKMFDHNLALLRNLDRFASLNCIILIGTSRKGFLGSITGKPVDQRAIASVVSSLAAAVRGASVLRVHDVGPMVDALKVWAAIQGWNPTRK